MLIVKLSQIHGFGVFTEKQIRNGEQIGIWVSKNPPGRILYHNGMTNAWFESLLLGRFANHSETANTTPILEENEVILYSNGIEEGDEITVDYLTLSNLIKYVPYLPK